MLDLDKHRSRPPELPDLPPHAHFERSSSGWSSSGCSTIFFRLHECLVRSAGLKDIVRFCGRQQ